MIYAKTALLGIMIGVLSTGTQAQNLTPVYKEVDCGEMLYDKPATYVVEFKNTSAQSVEIKDVDTGCGCTTADFTKGKLMPNAVAKVSLTFDAKQLGHFDRVVRVFTTDGRQGTPAEVVVRGVVVAKIVNYSGQYPCKRRQLHCGTCHQFGTVHTASSLQRLCACDVRNQAFAIGNLYKWAHHR